MAHARYGTPAPQWRKHLRRYWKRVFWKRHRRSRLAPDE